MSPQESPAGAHAVPVEDVTAHAFDGRPGLGLEVKRRDLEQFRVYGRSR